MRSIGSLTDEQQAGRFAAFLDSQEISSRVDASGDRWEIWVVDEDQVETAKEHFAEFQSAPDDPRYVEAIQNSKRHKLRQLEEALARRQAQIRRTRKMPWERGMPLTMLLVVASLYISIVTRFGDDAIPLTRAVKISDPKATVRRIQNERLTEWPRGLEAIPEVRDGQIWRLFTPIFLHFTPWHLLFNMSWLVVLGGNIEVFKGTRYLLLLVLFLALFSNLAELYSSGTNFGGMSGVGYGLFGYIWLRSRLVPEDGFQIAPSTVFMFFAWALICASGAAGPIANAAHFGGLAAGAFFGAMPAFSLRNPR